MSSGIEYGKTQNLCIRGLIAQDRFLQRKCPLVFGKDVDVVQRVQEVVRNKYVVYTDDELYKYRCKANKPEPGRLASGTYIITLEPDCVLDTDEWMLRGLNYFQCMKL